MKYTLSIALVFIISNVTFSQDLLALNNVSEDHIEVLNTETSSIPDEYQYDNSITYTLSTTTKKKKTTMEINYMIPNSGNHLITSMNTSGVNIISIIDFSNNKMISVMEQQKMAMVMNLDNKLFATIVGIETENANSESESNEIVKTGNSKVILGYNCEEYTISSENSTGYYWITQDAGISMNNLFSANNPVFKNNDVFNGFQTPNDGTILEMNMTTKDSKNRETNTTLIVKELDKTGGDISLNGYQILSL